MDFVKINTDCPEYVYMLPWKLFRRIKGTEEFRCFGAYRGKKLLGCAVFTRMAATKSLNLEYLYVEPRYRGLGIGTDLLEAVKKMLMDQGVIRLCCSLDAAAIIEGHLPFLDRAGFVRSGQGGLLVEMPPEQSPYSDMLDTIRKNTLLLNPQPEENFGREVSVSLVRELVNEI